ncbi:MAG TPA: DUF3089 domain-containing protein [Acidimicrobiales bacterium]|jgi:hypothetical protein|nr:DUF3089 domain-containing protein [Acidimicrobiales bacterium]
MRRSLPHRAATLSTLVAGTLLLGACAAPASSATASTHKVAATVWLCRPGASPDPCASSLATTIVQGTGQRTVDHVVAPRHPAFDCFYVYPTVSTETSRNSDLKVQQAEVNAARAQAAPFSQVCRVYAPMYRQITLPALVRGAVNAATLRTAYDSLLAGWKDYLAHRNRGRPIVFLGHSQGAAMLIRLLEHEVDPSRALRARMVSAILLGGNVAVPVGGLVGATFSHLALCTSATQDGCVIAYSTFPGQPPADALFGRPGQGVSLLSGQTATSGVQVACVNPAAIGGTTGALVPWFRTRSESLPAPAVSTPWVSFPGLYDASCRSSGGATWLQVTDVAQPGDARPVVTEVLGPTWGFHIEDVNLATQNLVDDVHQEELAYTAAHP